MDGDGSGRSRGGLSSKIHLAVDGWGLPMGVILTPGQDGDNPQLLPLLDGISIRREGGGRPGPGPRRSWRTRPTRIPPPGRRCADGRPPAFDPEE